jgi:hypothetical protein
MAGKLAVNRIANSGETTANARPSRNHVRFIGELLAEGDMLAARVRLLSSTEF